MNRLLKHTVLFLILIIFWSCAGEASYDMNKSESGVAPAVAEEMEAITLNFDSLNEEQLVVYQKRAEQKVRDFFDYVKIISNPDVEKDFKNHTKIVSENLFINDTTSVFDQSLGTYLDSLQTIEKQLIIIPEKLKTNIPLTKDSTAYYKGTLQSKLITNSGKQSKLIDFYLIEIEKDFGSSKQQTIEVKLGNIY